MNDFTATHLMIALAIVIGGVLILGALFLLWGKKISLEQVATNPTLKDAAMKIEIQDLISLGTNVPALGLFLVGLALVTCALYYANQESERRTLDTKEQLAKVREDLAKSKDELTRLRTTLTVRGVIAKEDGISPDDVQVQTHWPPFYPDTSGKLNGLLVHRNSEGRLPVLAFLPQGKYGSASLDLNTEARVEGSDVVIPAGAVILKKLPGAGGVQ